jgi:hypothetical protein
MERRDALHLAVTAATIAFALAFGYPSVSPTSVYWYYPLEHRWAYEVAPSGLAIDFYGRTLMATIIAILVGAAAYAITRKVRVPRVIFGLFTAWAITATVLVAAHYSWTLHFRHPIPLEAPDDASE